MICGCCSTFGALTRDHAVPFQCSTSVRFVRPEPDTVSKPCPTAHTLVLAIAATLVSVSATVAPGCCGGRSALGTMFQLLPRQRSVSVRPPAVPTAHTSVAETASLPRSVPLPALGVGLVTTFHAAPSQCSTSGCNTVDGGLLRVPTAHTSLLAIAVTAVNHPRLALSARGAAPAPLPPPEWTTNGGTRRLSPGGLRGSDRPPAVP